MNTTNTDRTKICPQCNTPFTCSTHDCWCSKLPAVMPLDDAAQCLCPDCLGAIIDKKMKEINALI